MTDIATISTAGPIGFAFDWALSGGALTSDQQMDTAVIISLFTDKVAAPDDILPDNSGDRRGCWSDMSLDGSPPDDAGSLLWLLSRAKATVQTAARARRYALDALQWFLDDGVANEINVTARYLNREQLALGIDIIRQVNGKPVNHRYDFVWNPALPVPFAPQRPPVLSDGLTDLLVTEDGRTISIF